ncbi:MAG: Dabb family protein [Planctomycetota bacterium]
MAASQMLGHMVYFTLNDNSEAAKATLIEACHKYLKGHPGVLFYAAGTRVGDLNREVNDQTFDVALQLVFESREAHDAYQTHEQHVKFIAENKPNWKQTRVFDAYVA